MKYRRWLRTKLLFLSILLLLPPSAAAAVGELQARNVILLIGDGMGPSHFGIAWTYSNRQLKRDLRMSALMKAGKTAYLMNDTADAIVTESAAAAGQIATGKRMAARALSMAADGQTPVTTIMEIAREKGLSTGLVTTSGITDATPAAFATHAAHRSQEESVAEQLLSFGVDVLLGGRKQFFLPVELDGRRRDGRNLIEEARGKGYTIAETAAALRDAPTARLLGLFSMGNMSYEIDRAATLEPSLAEMTLKALEILSKNETGFIAMIEGGRIDHAAHCNDASATIREILAFDEAVGVAIDFARDNPATLLIVTADHETGGMAMIGHSKESREYAGIDLQAIQKARGSFEVMAGTWGKKPTPERIREDVGKYLGIALTDDEARTVADDTIKRLDPYNYTRDQLHTLAFVLRPYLRIGWASQTHTASPLFLFGSGPGSEKIGGLLHNTDIFELMKTALRLDQFRTTGDEAPLGSQHQ